MANKHSPTPLRADQLQIQLPELHPKQREVLEDPTRFKVVVCGRQFGKTSLGALMCVIAALRGGTIWWVAPTYPLGRNGWDVLVQLCSKIDGVRYEGRPNFKIFLPGGGSIQVKSADDPDALRGATLDGVVFDEAAIAKPEAWPYLRPTLAIRKGWAVFISTPKGTGDWFHEMYEDAGRLKDWKRWRIPSSESPFMDSAEIEASRETMSALLFSQEYEAEFISYSTGMFRQEWLRHYRTSFTDDERIVLLGDEPVTISDCTRFHTVDLAWSLDERADYTVISSWAATQRGHLLLLDVNRGHFEGPDILPKMRLAYEKWGGVLVVERATRQMSIVQEAARQGLPVREVRADKDKIARALPATARMEQGRIWFPAISEAPWLAEIEDELLSFPAGRHDDFVDTLAYAVLQVAQRSQYEERPMRILGKRDD